MRGFLKIKGRRDSVRPFSNRFAISVGVILTLMIGAFSTHAASAGEPSPALKKIIEAAKKEGHLTTYISGYERVLEPFKKKYPEIKVVSITGSSTQIAQRILTERRAEKYLADIGQNRFLSD